MQKSNAPTPFTVAFANGAGSGYRNVIPIPSQIPITPGAASYTDGFPPVTMEPTGSGGIPPYGADMNGVLYAATLATLWEQAGFLQSYSSSLSTAYGGYPAQSLLAMGSGLGLWLNTADNNTTSPDATGSAGWVPVLGNAGKTVMNVTGGTYTPDPSVLGVKLLYLQGTLASNLTLVLPLTAGASWKIYNNTTGSFSVTAGGATGTSVTIPQGNLVEVATDGTNFYTASIAGGPYLPLTGTAVAATKLATARTIAISGDMVWSVTFDGSANVTAAGTIQAGAITLVKMAALQANSLLGNPTSSAATPQAITLTNGLQFTGAVLGMGAITPTSVNAGSGAISGGPITGTSFTGSLPSSITTGSTTQALTLSTTGAAYGLAIRDTSGTASIVFQPGNGSTTPNKTIRANGINGNLEIVNNAYSAVVAAISDAGYMTISQTLTCQTVTIQNQTQFSFTGFASGACFWQGNGGSGDNLLSMSRTGSSNYAMTWYGTINISSDEDLKHGFEPLIAQPMHDAFWGSYVRNGSKDELVEYGSTAQSIAQFHPHHVRPSGIIKPNGAPELGVDFIRVAVEQGIWCGREIDHEIKPLLRDLINRVAALEGVRV